MLINQLFILILTKLLVITLVDCYHSDVKRLTPDFHGSFGNAIS